MPQRLNEALTFWIPSFDGWSRSWMRSINVLRMPSHLQTDDKFLLIIARSLTIHEQLTPVKRKFGNDSDSSATARSGPPPKPVSEPAKTKGALLFLF